MKGGKPEAEDVDADSRPVVVLLEGQVPVPPFIAMIK